jgi:multidrug efflux pump subunit AcrB
VVPEAPHPDDAGRGVFFVGSFMLVPLLPTGFMPPDDLSQTQVTVSLPPGSTFPDLGRAEQARALVQKNPHVKLVYTAIGGGSAGATRSRRRARPRCARRR